MGLMLPKNTVQVSQPICESSPVRVYSAVIYASNVQLDSTRVGKDRVGQTKARDDVLTRRTPCEGG